jgi:polyisoprenoid-binding protein YceI
MQKYKWKVLPADSSIQLRVRYMNIGLINASFKKFKGDMIAGAEFSEAIISFEIESKAIDTQDAQLNKTLCSEPFLFVEKFPNICFFSKSGCHKSSGGIQELTGDLFIKGHSKSLTLIVNYSNFRTKGSIQMVNCNRAQF